MASCVWFIGIFILKWQIPSTFIGVVSCDINHHIYLSFWRNKQTKTNKNKQTNKQTKITGLLTLLLKFGTWQRQSRPHLPRETPSQSRPGKSNIAGKSFDPCYHSSPSHVGLYEDCTKNYWCGIFRPAKKNTQGEFLAVSQCWLYLDVQETKICSINKDAQRCKKSQLTFS